MAYVDAVRRLQLAVLTRAIDDVEGRVIGRESAHTHYLRKAALAWIQSGRRDHLFAFEVICRDLGLDAEYLRRHPTIPQRRHKRL